MDDAEVLARALRGEFVGGIERCGPVLVSALRELTMEYRYLRMRAAGWEATATAQAKGGNPKDLVDECHAKAMDDYPKWRDRFIADQQAEFN